MTNLPQETVDRLRKSYKQAKNVREKERYQALWLKARGYKRKEICELMGIGGRSLGRWIQKYNKKGLSGLRDKAQPGNHRILTNEQKRKIKDIIHKQTPEDYKYQGKFWKVSSLKRLIRDQFKVEYRSDYSYRRLFKWCGFSHHKPDKVNKKQSVKSIKEWEKKIKKDWRGIAAQMGWYW